MVMTGFQNGIFLPLAFAPAFFVNGGLDDFLTLLFLFNMLSVPSFFSLGVWMMKNGIGGQFRKKQLLSPPIVATAIGLLFAVAGWTSLLPDRILRIGSTLGSLATPLSIIVVGGIIVTSIPKAKAVEWIEPVKLTVLKSLVFPPLLVTAFVALVRPHQGIGMLLILESAMPSALLIGIVAPKNEKNRTMIAGGILLTHLATILTLPLFMGLYGVIYR